MHTHYVNRPHAARYMAGTLYPAWRKASAPQIPALSAHWEAYRVPSRDVDDFAQLCGLPAQRQRLPPLFIHATAFRLQMALLAHRSLPFPIWRTLQVRNQLFDWCPIAVGVTLDFECRLHAHRSLPKGLEVDLYTRVVVADTLVAESLNTFYVRGFAGAAVSDFSPPVAPAATQRVSGWRMPATGSWRFGQLTGDYNPVHMWSPYAQMMGFRRAFLHPLRVVGQCLARSGAHEMPGPRRLDVWMKGPVHHDAAVELRSSGTAQDITLVLLDADDPRPAVVTRARPADERDRIAGNA